MPFFAGASERSVLLIVEVYETFSYLHIFSPSSTHLFTSSHLLIITPALFHIFSSSHLLTFTPSRLLPFLSSHLLICISSRLHTSSSLHLYIFSPSHLLIFSPSSHPPHILITSPHPHSHPYHILTSSHPHILKSSHPHIFTSLHLHIFSSWNSPLHFLTSSLSLLPSLSFLFSLLQVGAGAVPTRRHKAQQFCTRFDLAKKAKMPCLKWGSVAKNCDKIVIWKQPAQPFPFFV